MQNCQVTAYNKVSHSEPYFCKLVADMKENLSQLVARRIRELGLKKSELAKQVGVSRTYITDLANGTGNTQSGQYRPRPEIIEKLAKFLEVEINEILNSIGYASPNTTPEIPESVKNAFAREGRLTEKDQILIAQMIETMKLKNTENGEE